MLSVFGCGRAFQTLVQPPASANRAVPSRPAALPGKGLRRTALPKRKGRPGRFPHTAGWNSGTGKSGAARPSLPLWSSAPRFLGEGERRGVRGRCRPPPPAPFPRSGNGTPARRGLRRRPAKGPPACPQQASSRPVWRSQEKPLRSSRHDNRVQGGAVGPTQAVDPAEQDNIHHQKADRAATQAYLFFIVSPPPCFQAGIRRPWKNRPSPPYPRRITLLYYI